MQRTALRSRRSFCRLFIYALFVTLLFLAVGALLFFCWFCHDAIKSVILSVLRMLLAGKETRHE
jgi:hypothetical protein